MSARCQADKPSDCHRNYCVRNNACADEAASATAPVPPIPSYLPLADRAWVEQNKGDPLAMKGGVV